MTAQKLVSADDAQKTLNDVARLRAAIVQDREKETDPDERFDLDHTIASLDFTAELARTVIALHADRRAASRLRAGLQQAIASQQVRTMIGWRCGVCGRAWPDHAPECWVGAAAATLDEDGAA